MQKTVLVVEDEEDIRETLCEFLDRAGYKTISAKNGREALEMMHASASPDAILMDMMMPLMGGEELLGILAAHPSWKTIPVLMMTAATLLAQPANLAAFVRKPFRANQILSSLAKLWDTSTTPSAP